MPSNMLGLVEMVLVFSLALGLGLFELWSLKRPRRPTAPPPSKDDESSP